MPAAGHAAQELLAGHVGQAQVDHHAVEHAVVQRLQGRLAEAMAANGLTDVAALIFNTHGESMGRGAHPSTKDN